MTEQVGRLKLPVIPKTEMVNWPLFASLGILGKKWSLLVIFSIGQLRLHRFNEILRATPGLTPRMLTKRLRELEREGFVTLVVKRPNWVRWDLTQKGYDALPILMAFAQFG